MTNRTEVNRTLTELTALAGGFIAGETTASELDAAIAVLRSTLEAARQAEGADRAWGTSSSIAEVIGDNIGDARRQAGWTQQQLADAMVCFGFTWNRQTVAETERGVKRRASHEELLGLAALFAQPVVAFMRPHEHNAVDLTETTELDGWIVQELLVGHGASEGRGGSTWRAATAACAGRVTHRPIPAFEVDRGGMRDGA